MIRFLSVVSCLIISTVLSHSGKASPPSTDATTPNSWIVYPALEEYSGLSTLEILKKWVRTLRLDLNRQLNYELYDSDLEDLYDRWMNTETKYKREVIAYNERNNYSEGSEKMIQIDLEPHDLPDELVKFYIVFQLAEGNYRQYYEGTLDADITRERLKTAMADLNKEVNKITILGKERLEVEKFVI